MCSLQTIYDSWQFESFEDESESCLAICLFFFLKFLAKLLDWIPYSCFYVFIGRALYNQSCPLFDAPIFVISFRTPRFENSNDSSAYNVRDRTFLSFDTRLVCFPPSNRVSRVKRSVPKHLAEKSEARSSLVGFLWGRNNIFFMGLFPLISSCSHISSKVWKNPLLLRCQMEN